MARLVHEKLLYYFSLTHLITKPLSEAIKLKIKFALRINSIVSSSYGSFRQLFSICFRGYWEQGDKFHR